MHPVLQSLSDQLEVTPKRWLVTGVAGFIGCNLAEFLLQAGQPVRGMDNFSTGIKENVERLRAKYPAHFEFIEGDLRVPDDCFRACEAREIVLHQAALGSVPRSFVRPVETHQVNTTGFLNLITAAASAGVGRFVYASSSAVYGADPNLPKVEHHIGRPLSPYAVTKVNNEHYAQVFSESQGLLCIGFRYFNVFGRHQRKGGPYSAVIPRWISTLLSGQRAVIYGDGLTSRDFCHVSNVVQANILAGITQLQSDPDSYFVFNVAVGERTSLSDLLSQITSVMESIGLKPPRGHIVEDFREGDVKHSLADTSRIAEVLGYRPICSVREGLTDVVSWYAAHHREVATRGHTLRGR